MSSSDHELLIRIDERVEVMWKQMMGNGQPGKCAVHEIRISSLERWRSKANGAFKILVWIITILVAASGTILAVARLS